MPEFSWRRVTETDFPLLQDWMARPHIHRWWQHDSTADAVRKDFGAAATGEVRADDLLVSLDQRPFGLVQRSIMSDYPEYLAELEPWVAVPEGALTLDYLVADQADTHRGLGTEMVKQVLGQSWQDYPQAPVVITPVVATNRPSWRLLERVGMTRIAHADLEPENPDDPRLHYVYRVGRPL